VRGHDVETVDFSKPEPLFTFGGGIAETRYGTDPSFDVSADGERFVFFDVPAAQGSTSSAEMVLIQHWADELRRLVPR
jgi:hypothetical protein